MNKKPMLVLNLSTFVVSLGYSLVIPAMPFYMKTLGAGGRELGWLTATYALAQTICFPYWGALSDRIGRKPVIGIGMFGYAISLFLFGIASSFWTLFSRAVYPAFCHQPLPQHLWHTSETLPKRKNAAKTWDVSEPPWVWER